MWDRECIQLSSDFLGCCDPPLITVLMRGRPQAGAGALGRKIDMRGWKENKTRKAHYRGLKELTR